MWIHKSHGLLGFFIIFCFVIFGAQQPSFTSTVLNKEQAGKNKSYQIAPFVSHIKKKVIQPWNNMRVIKWRQFLFYSAPFQQLMVIKLQNDKKTSLLKKKAMWSFLHSHNKEINKSMQDWINKIRVSKQWQISQFWASYPFNSTMLLFSWCSYHNHLTLLGSIPMEHPGV